MTTMSATSGFATDTRFAGVTTVTTRDWYRGTTKSMLAPPANRGGWVIAFCATGGRSGVCVCENTAALHSRLDAASIIAAA